MTEQTKQYRWPDLSPVIRRFVVRDETGRFGIGYQDNCYHADTMFAHPINVRETISAAGLPVPSNAIVITDTAFGATIDGTYKGSWYDDRGNTLHELTIVDDLGYYMPDEWAVVLDNDWNYGATLGKVGGEPPIKGQNANEMTVEQAEEFAHEVGEQVTARGIRLAARNGYIPGARKIGRDWLIPYDGYNHYLDNRPKRGPKPK